MKKLTLSLAVLAMGGVASAALVNGGFETGDTSGWDVSAGNGAGVGTTYANTGTYSVSIDSTGAGQWSSPNVFQSFAAVEGDVASLSAVMLQTALGATDWGTIKLEWKDSGGNNLDCNAGLIEGVVDGDGQSYEGIVGTTQLGAGKVETLDTWVATSISGTAPAGTASVSFYLMNVNGTGGATYHFDDAVAGVIPEPATIGLLAVFGGGLVFARRYFMI